MNAIYNQPQNHKIYSSQICKGYTWCTIVDVKMSKDLQN